MAERACKAGGAGVKCFPIFENKRGLPEAYNDFLDNHKDFDKRRDLDCVLFIHDDLEIRDITVCEQLENAKTEGYDVIGVAGSKAYNVPDPNVPTGWWSPLNAQYGLAG